MANTYPIRLAGAEIQSRFIPNDNEIIISNYALLEDYYLQGGYRVCANISERNLITADRRKLGMMVHTLDDDKYWVLINEPFSAAVYNPGDTLPTTDSDWEEFSSGQNWIYINSGETTATNLEGIPPGTVFTGTTLNELWTQLLYPVVDPYFTINPDSYFVVGSGETVSFELEFFGNWSGITWEISSDSLWTSVSITGGTGSTTFDVVCEPNDDASSDFRKAVITILVNGTDYGYCYIEQFAGGPWTYINTGDTTATNLEGYPVGTNFPPSGQTNYEMWTTLLYPYISTWWVTPSSTTVLCPSGTTSYDVEFKANWLGTKNWRISINEAPSWCRLTTSPTGTGNATFTVEYDNNCLWGSAQRTANIIVTLVGTNPVNYRTAYLIQPIPTYPPAQITFTIDAPYLYEVGAPVIGKTGTWSTTEHDSIVLSDDSIKITGPLLDPITGLTYDGSTGMTFTSTLEPLSATTIGPWFAVADTTYNSVIMGTSQSISWDYKVYWGRFSGATINGAQIINNLTSQFGNLAGNYTVLAGGAEYFYWCVYNNGLNRMSKAIMADVGQQLAMVQTYNPDYSYFDVGVGYRNLGYGLVDIIINGNTYSYRVYRSANVGVNQTEISIITL